LSRKACICSEQCGCRRVQRVPLTQHLLMAGSVPFLKQRLLPAGGERVSVAKLQVALLGSARSLQRELDRLADRADTTTPEGLHFVLQGAALIGRLHPSARVRLSRACAQCVARRL